MSIFILPSSIALVIKLIALRYAYIANFSTVFKGMLLFLALQNLCEAYQYIDYGSLSEIQANWFMRSYYFAGIMVAAFLMLHVSEVSNFKHGKILRSLLGITLVPLLLLLISDQIIAGAVPAAYSLKSVHGPWYALCVVYFSSAIIFIFWRLVRGYVQADSNDDQIRNLYTLVAIAPLLVISPLVVTLQYLGYQFSAAILVPAASTLFVGAILYAESHPNITDIRIHLPFSAERQVSKSLFRLCSSYSKQQISYKAAQSEFERSLITYSLLKNDFNMMKTAEVMNIDRSTLYSACKRLNIKLDRR